MTTLADSSPSTEKKGILVQVCSDNLLQVCLIYDLKYFIGSLLYSPVSENVKMYIHVTALSLNQTTY